MKEYVFLYVDQEHKITYYYDMDNGHVFADDVSKRSEQAGKIGGWGGIVGIILYALFGRFTYGFAFTPWIASVLAICLGLLASLLTFLWINRLSVQVFRTCDSREVSYQDVLWLVKKGKTFRRRYYGILLFTILLSIGVTGMNLLIGSNAYLFFCQVLAWWMTGTVCGTIRPFCYSKLVRSLKKGVLYRNYLTE